MKHFQFMNDTMLEVEEQIFSYITAVRFVVINKYLAKILYKIVVQNVEKAVFFVEFVLQKFLFFL